MWMESHGRPAHVPTMASDMSQRISDKPLGEPAPNRGPVDLLLEATRLKFTDAEIAELKRLYAANNQAAKAKTPQKSD
jgi:hypothetical protein